MTFLLYVCVCMLGHVLAMVRMWRSGISYETQFSFLCVDPWIKLWQSALAASLFTLSANLPTPFFSFKHYF